MTTRTVDAKGFHQKARQIRARVPAILSQWGLQPRFSRWRLTQDPDSGMVVLFAVLDTTNMASHGAAPLSDYFDPRLLHDLADDLHLRIVSSSSDGPRYVFILDPGSVGTLLPYMDLPFLDLGRLLVGAIRKDESVDRWRIPHVVPALPAHIEIIDDLIPASRSAGAFLEVLDGVAPTGDGAFGLSAQRLPGPVVVDEEGFYKRVAAHRADRDRHDRMWRLLSGSGE